MSGSGSRKILKIGQRLLIIFYFNTVVPFFSGHSVYIRALAERFKRGAPNETRNETAI